MMNAFDDLPAESAAVIVDELTKSDPSLLAQLRSSQEPSNEQRAAVNEMFARAVIRSLGPEWVPNAHGLAVERAVKAFLEKWPLNR